MLFIYEIYEFSRKSMVWKVYVFLLNKSNYRTYVIKHILPSFGRKYRYVYSTNRVGKISICYILGWGRKILNKAFS